MHKKSVLFYSVLMVFLGTALITFLGLSKFLDVNEQYLGLLVKTLIGQVVIAVLSLFRGAKFFSDDEKIMSNIQAENESLKAEVSKNKNTKNKVCVDCDDKKQKIDVLENELRDFKSLTSTINGMFSHNVSLDIEDIKSELSPDQRAEDVWSSINFLSEQGKIKAYGNKQWKRTN